MNKKVSCNHSQTNQKKDEIPAPDLTNEESEIREGQPEIYHGTCELLIPANAQKIKTTRSFEFYRFTDPKTAKTCLGIRVISYHPGELIIPFSELLQFIDDKLQT